MKPLILFSGGVDSTLLAVNTVQGAELLFVNYGQPSLRREYAAAVDIAKRLEMPLHLLGLVHMGFLFNNKANVLEGRNGIFVMMAAAKAVQLGCDSILLGACLDDAENYSDCRPEWVKAMNEVLNSCELPTLYAPLIGMTKADIHAALRRFAPGFIDLTYSCYLEERCGECDSCRSNDVKSK